MNDTWLDIDDEGGFGLHHLPVGSVVDGHGRQFAAMRIGDYALDLSAAGAFAPLFADGTLDPFLAAGPQAWSGVRSLITRWLTDADHRSATQQLLTPVDRLTPVLGFQVADYVDFYASEHHASNVGRIFRPEGQPLKPNWKHLPVGYHGRAGTVVVSGTGIRRPHGQSRVDGQVTFGPSTRLDIEAEVGFVVGVGSRLGEPVPLPRFGEHVFGLCLLNDWSARDIQSWETVPLGPFLGKSFATSVAGWITPLAALDAAWTAPPPREPAPLPYLDDSATPSGLDLALSITLNGTEISTPPFASMYWTPAQMLAHLTVNGASLRPGDLYASGTVSGPQPAQRGSLLELSWNGTQPLTLRDGSERAFLADGDEVVLSATAPGVGGVVRLAEVRGTVLPA